jgi:hypothetical protein
MASSTNKMLSTNQDGGLEKSGENKTKRKCRPQTRSNPNSRSNSRHSSPANAGNSKASKCENIWNCQLCKKVFNKPDDKLLECQRCSEHFCIQCLNKSVEEYNLMEKSDIMWFCGPCREKVEKNIIVDREIEDMCREIVERFENRLKIVEEQVEKKCDEDRVRSIIEEEIEKLNVTENISDKDQSKSNSVSGVNAVMSEINERKNRENNMIVYGVKESNLEGREARQRYDTKQIQNISDACGVSISSSNLSKIVRLGRYSKEKQRDRPILVTFKEPDTKIKILRGG